MPEVLKGLATLHLSADAGTLDRIAAYLSELERWNARYGFVKASSNELVRLHVLDSLAGLELLASYVPSGVVLDFGSGAGFPGLPLAIFLPQHRFVLCERKAVERAFLANMTALLKLARVAVTDDVATQPKASFQAVVCRAVTSLKEIYSTVRDYLAPGGIIFAYKGKRGKIDAEIAEITRLSLTIQVHPVPGGERERHIVVARP
jgi:16S rRNA (guanine527-N7)-methyltransferase